MEAFDGQVRTFRPSPKFAAFGISPWLAIESEEPLKKRSSVGFCPKEKRAFSEEIIFLGPCDDEEDAFASAASPEAENRKQPRDKIGGAMEVVDVAAGVAPTVEAAAKDEKHRIGEVGVVKPYG